MAADAVRQKVEELNLEGKTPADIDDGAPLFGEGLGLDSLDALQLAVAVEESFGVRVPEGEEALVGSTLDEDALAAAAAAARAAARPIDDLRAPAAYRTHVAGVLVQRAARIAAARARGDS